MTRKKHRTWLIARRIVQIAVLLLFCAAPLAVGMGLLGAIAPVEKLDVTASMLPFFGSLSSSTVGGTEGFGGVVVVDPYAVLEVICASKSFEVGWLVSALPALIVYGLLRGRIFCGWVCPVNLLLEGLDWLRAKLNLKVAQHALPRHTKLWVAAALLVICAISGVVVFEMFSPIAAVNKGILFGTTAGAITLLAIVVAELFWGRRVWCRALCPLGGFYEALGTIGLLRVRIDHDACTTCGRCRDVCLCDPEILQPAIDGTTDGVAAADCMLCGECIDECPERALKVGLRF